MPAQRAHHGAFGEDAFGRAAERGARFFGTPQYIVGQTIAVIVWIVLNSAAIAYEWDPYPFILLNLAFSTQAAYAAPLILLAQTRQAERDKAAAEREERQHDRQAKLADEHVEAIRQATRELRELLEANIELTRRVVASVERG
jgi:uncharacterized membrane protein